MALRENQVVTMNFTLKDDQGNVVDSTTGQESFSFISGSKQILPKLEERIGEMLIGSKKSVVLLAEDGYGEYQEEAVRTVSRSEFPPDTEIEVGQGFFATAPDGKHVQFFIKNIDGDKVKVDFNHPLAGKELHFEVELLDLRDATPEELEHGHVHGEGGHHH